MKKKEGLDYKDYWKNRIGYNYETEIAIYAYVCRSSRGLPKKQREVDEKYQFNSYNEWKLHVMSSILNKQVDIKEFRRYLINKRRTCYSSLDLLNVLLIPIVVYLLGELLLEGYKALTSMSMAPIKLEGASTQLSILINFLVALLLIMVPCIGLCIILWKILKMVIITYSNNNIEKSFYEDYIEIIDSLMNASNKTETEVDK